MTASISRRLYQQFLLLYPEPFRREFGEEMLSTFDQCRTAQGSWHLLAEVLVSIARQQIRYVSTPLPKTAPLHAEIAWSPKLAQRLAMAVIVAAVITSVSAGGRPHAPGPLTVVPREVRFWFPTGIVVLERNSDASETWRVLRPDHPAE